MTRWRVVKAPASRHGPRYAVLSDREPGPVMGARGGLHGWTELLPPICWTTFEDACLFASAGNGKPGTANMGPQSVARGFPGPEHWAALADVRAEVEASRALCERLDKKYADVGQGPREAAERAGAT